MKLHFIKKNKKKQWYHYRSYYCSTNHEYMYIDLQINTDTQISVKSFTKEI